MRKLRLAVAVHEAGHAVVQMANPPAPYIDWIALDGLTENELGRVGTSARWQPYMAEVRAPMDIAEQWRGLAWWDTIVHLAGPIAEMRWGRNSRLAIQMQADRLAKLCVGIDVPEGDIDAMRVRARLMWAYPDAEVERFCSAWLEAEKQVAANWKAIVVIGRLLAKRGWMSGEELTAEWKRLQH